jgi:membrane protein DedA with SNARE-associated domain
MEHVYAVLLQWAQAHGLHGVFVFMVVESAGVPFPTELGFITAQGMMDARLCAYWEAFAWIAAGHLVGSGISYHLGLAGDSAISRYLAHRPSVVAVHEKMQRWFVKYGPATILFGRLVGQVRPWSSFVAGLARVPMLTFWLWTAVGTLAFTACTMWVTAVGYGYWLAHPRLRTPIIVVMLTVFYGLPLYHGIMHLVQRQRRRRLAPALSESAPEPEAQETHVDTPREPGG